MKNRKIRTIFLAVVFEYDCSLPVKSNVLCFAQLCCFLPLDSCFCLWLPRVQANLHQANSSVTFLVCFLLSDNSQLYSVSFFLLADNSPL